MLLKQRVKAGVLLYALLMASIFLLFLQFYVNRSLATNRQLMAQKEAGTSYLMAVLTSQEATGDNGRLQFDQGQTQFQRQEDKLLIQVSLSNGEVYHYTFTQETQENSEDKQPESSEKSPRPNESISSEGEPPITDSTTEPSIAGPAF